MPPNGYFSFLILPGTDLIFRKSWTTIAKRKSSLRTNKSTLKRSVDPWSEFYKSFFQLRAVAEELIRSADLIDGKISDKIGFFAEKGDKGSKWLEEDEPTKF